MTTEGGDALALLLAMNMIGERDLRFAARNEADRVKRRLMRSITDLQKPDLRELGRSCRDGLMGTLACGLDRESIARFIASRICL